MRVRFTDDLKIGHTVIDEQHRELFERADRLVSSPNLVPGKKEFDEALDFLHSYVAEHFESEEELIRLTRYPGEKAHKVEHEYFRRELADVDSQAALGHSGDDLRLRIYFLIADRFVAHIKDSDRKLADFLRVPD